MGINYSENENLEVTLPNATRSTRRRTTTTTPESIVQNVKLFYSVNREKLNIALNWNISHVSTVLPFLIVDHATRHVHMFIVTVYFRL